MKNNRDKVVLKIFGLKFNNSQFNFIFKIVLNLIMDSHN